MPMLRRRLTAEEVHFLMGERYAHVPVMWDEVFQPRYQTVRYLAALNRVDYEQPGTFYDIGPKSPSDCVWMVPVQP